MDAACLIMAAPTVLVGPHPSAGAMALMLNAFKPPLRYIGLIDLSVGAVKLRNASMISCRN